MDYFFGRGSAGLMAQVLNPAFQDQANKRFKAGPTSSLRIRRAIEMSLVPLPSQHVSTLV